MWLCYYHKDNNILNKHKSKHSQNATAINFSNTKRHCRSFATRSLTRDGPSRATKANCLGISRWEVPKGLHPLAKTFIRFFGGNLFPLQVPDIRLSLSRSLPSKQHLLHPLCIPRMSLQFIGSFQNTHHNRNILSSFPHTFPPINCLTSNMLQWHKNLQRK